MSLALYRRYRPETFEEVIGQEHVTVPLQQALRNNRVNHAYLFSGPRGCGKTTSARILARALNCAQGPTPTPCGECSSCRELARGGPGSIDVIEIDAASHGGVDDARDLRDRAFLAPAASRFKIYIIDEAHMVTSAGFNALLKVVEEPPEHLKFIFATTEPDKVIGTIRSRTHHYPFRLVPPGVLRDYLAQVCEREGVAVADGVLPLVVRAGAGSVRDSMSVLDQLLSGSGPDGVTYATATALLGYTDAALLDDVVEALAARDGAAVFRGVDRVVEGGHDPRRFVTDLLERLRDLVVLSAVPDAGTSGMLDAPADQVERMRAQAAAFGPAELSRAADIVNTGLTEMRGATAPRLQLELICARMLLPAAYDDEAGLLARVERLERRQSLGIAAPPPPDPGPPVVGGTQHAEGAPGRSEWPEPPGPPPARPAPAPPSGGGVPTLGAPPWRAERPSPPADRDSRAHRGSATPSGPTRRADSAGPGPAAPEGPAAPGGDSTGVRRRWPEILEKVKERKRFSWMLLSQNANLLGLTGDRLTIGFVNAGARDRFAGGESMDILRASIRDIFGVDWHIDCVVDPSRNPGGTDAGPPRTRPSGPPPGRPSAGPSGAPPAPPPSGGDGPPPPPGAGAHGGGSAGTRSTAPEPAGPVTGDGPATGYAAAAVAVGAAAVATDAAPGQGDGAGGSDGVRESRAERARAAEVPAPAPASNGVVGVGARADEPPDEDGDGPPDQDEETLTLQELLQRELGAQVIARTGDDPGEA